MPSQAAVLVDRFTAVFETLVAAVRSCSTEQWQARCPDEGWTVGVTAHHVAKGLPAQLAFVRAAAAGKVLALDSRVTDARNAEHALRYATCTPEEVLALLDQGGRQAQAFLAWLDDDTLGQLLDIERQTPSLRQVIELGLIGHLERHTASIRHTLAGDGATPATPSLLDQLGALEHQQWIEWTQALAKQEQLSPERAERWRRDWVPYEELPDLAKQADRLYADRVLKVLDRYVLDLIGPDDEPADNTDATARNALRRALHERHAAALRGL